MIERVIWYICFDQQYKVAEVLLFKNTQARSDTPVIAIYHTLDRAYICLPLPGCWQAKSLLVFTLLSLAYLPTIFSYSLHIG